MMTKIENNRKEIKSLGGFCLLLEQKEWSLEELITKPEEEPEDRVMKVIQFFM